MSDATRANADPATVYLKDYRPPGWLVDSVDLQFTLSDRATRVNSVLTLRRNPDQEPGPLKLDGEQLKLIAISVDGRTLSGHEYQQDEHSLTIPDVADSLMLTTITEINPEENTSLMGLYLSSGNFCTQCEAEGFRKITFFPDRPDVLSKFTVTILADKQKYPVLLSNGNLQESGDAEPDEDGNARHFAIWHDPHPKPCYLFALVAGDLAHIHDEFVTKSGNKVDLYIYVQPHNIDQCDHAMRSLKNAMRWDEQVYGREYDLDVYNIVAVDDFNMGAMENKGLNIFNSRYVLARPDTATDSDYQNIEGVIGHEYFHNWSGNRVTCRDWFQLSLKEGFTVFRDQEFSADMSARGIKRIQDVNMLRTHQFREDAGPMAHPIRPDQYVEINNFYTLTVYEKGAEVVRMLYHLLGPENFRKGTDLYFSRHDGQAVTTDDFVQALEDASGHDLGQFRLWYSTAGTPELTVTQSYDDSSYEYRLKIEQHTPDTPGQTGKPPLHIPVRMGLVDRSGDPLPLECSRIDNNGETETVLHLRQTEENYTFSGIRNRPVASLLRGFSAPVKLNMDRSADELYFLMTRDPDEFNRWNASQMLATQLMVEQLDSSTVTVDSSFIEACRQTLNDSTIKPALAAEILRLPTEGFLADARSPANPDRIHAVHSQFRNAIAHNLHDDLIHQYERLARHGEYSIEPDAMGERALRNLCLGYLMAPPRDQLADGTLELCIAQFRQGGNMTDVIAALACLSNCDDPAREESLGRFYDQWKEETLVVDKWFSLQAMSVLPGTLEQVISLTSHSAFNIRNPNRVRSLIGAFANGNPFHFHRGDGAGYRFVADRVMEIDSLNPQVAARLVSVFTRWRQYENSRQQIMQQQLERIMDKKNLSRDVKEIVSKSLRA